MDDCSLYFYNPSLAAAILFTALYTIPTVFTLHRINNTRTWYFLCVPLGGLLEIAGYAIRIGSVKSPCSVGLYSASTSLIIIAPLLVAAGNYLLLGRLILAVLPDNNQKILGVSPTNITKIFVGIDILSFVVQVSGSAVASSNGWEGNTESAGVDVLIAGLATQLATVIVFLVLLWVFSTKAYFGPHIRESAPKKWERAFEAAAISTTLISNKFRSVYRLIEFALGVDGYPFGHEWPFYVFESAPMLLAIVIFCLWFPPGYLPKHKFDNDVEVGKEAPIPPHEPFQPVSERYA